MAMMDDNETAKLALEYLKILQEGRVKPDKNQNHPTIRDSIDNAEYIRKLNNTLESYFKEKLNNATETST